MWQLQRVQCPLKIEARQTFVHQTKQLTLYTLKNAKLKLLQFGDVDYGVPVLTKPCFISLESNIGECWKQSLLESMIEAGREEKRQAEERGNYHEGVPTITVLVDGGRSKRSHKHSYNAKIWGSYYCREGDRETTVYRCTKQVLCCMFPQYSQRKSHLFS